MIRCRVEPYLIKAVARSATTPATLAPGVRPWRPTRRGAPGKAETAVFLVVPTCRYPHDRSSLRDVAQRYQAVESAIRITGLQRL